MHEYTCRLIHRENITSNIAIKVHAPRRTNAVITSIHSRSRRSCPWIRTLTRVSTAWHFSQALRLCTFRRRRDVYGVNEAGAFTLPLLLRNALTRAFTYGCNVALVLVAINVVPTPFAVYRNHRSIPSLKFPRVNHVTFFYAFRAHHERPEICFHISNCEGCVIRVPFVTPTQIRWSSASVSVKVRFVFAFTMHPFTPL
jgi:hypothetical protein